MTHYRAISGLLVFMASLSLFSAEAQETGNQGDLEQKQTESHSI